MAIEITQDTVVKILVRRGTDSERQLTTLTEGELGYCVDTQRVFVGDGITRGGIVAGNKFLGNVNERSGFSSIAQVGDTVYQTGGGSKANTLYAYNPGVVLGDAWVDVHPQPFSSALQKDPQGYWRVSKEFSGDSSFPPSGLTIQYLDSPGTFNSITKTYNRIDFDSRFISLSATYLGDGSPTNKAKSSFYLGDFRYKTVTNSLCATLNIDNSLFLNTDDANPYQVRFYANNPLKSNYSLIESISGGFDIKANGDTESFPLSLYVKNKEAIRIYSTGSTMNTVFSSLPNSGSYASPNFDFRGVTKFRDDVFYEASADVTILGNLSVYGDTTYLETTVTTTSALSVINNNKNITALTVAQYNAGSPDNQAIATFLEGLTYTGGPRPVLNIKESQYVAINAPIGYNLDTGLVDYSFVVFGDSIFKTHPDYSPLGGNNGIGVGNFGVDVVNSINLSAGQNLRTYSGGSSTFTSQNNNTITSNAGTNTVTGPYNTLTATTQNTINGFTQLNGNLDHNGNLDLDGSDVNIYSSGDITLGAGNDLIISSNTLDVDSSGNGTLEGRLTLNGNIAGGFGAGTLIVNGGGYISGSLYLQGDVIAYATSDKRLKINATPIDSALEKVKKLSGIKFEWAPESGHSGEDYGVIAQDVEKVMPEIVVTRENGYKAIRYEKLIPLLIEAIKELDK